jgi:hypothetical protein
MGFHSFSVDPRTVLGVGPEASLAEIHEAYRVKSKKHHPDMGGDEWAFCMVARAYEVLKAMLAESSSQPWQRREADGAGAGRGQPVDWAWARSTPFGASGDSNIHTSGTDRKEAEGSGRRSPGDPDQDDREDPASWKAAGASPEPTALRVVDVELIWTRFQKDGPALLASAQEADDATLSVCMVISWPPENLVDRTAEFASSGEILRNLIDLFERLRDERRVVAARSRIEDGRFVGWLSYPDVLTVQDAFLALRELFRARSLKVKLRTRDERVPFDWYSPLHQPVMTQAS